ncbi:hypothetical protein GCM10018952_22840 [Streptosporangium vulgare]|uniref:Integrase core domain-containing protein n=1 Tax=Streptosporangium vulgare TaxID=46190 RepID=A0ABV5TS46_9ACTN
MPPISLDPPSGHCLSFTEREEIAVLRTQNYGVRRIARRRGRAPSRSCGSFDVTRPPRRSGRPRVQPSVGRTGQCWDNALAESFFATLEGELLGERPWLSHAAARSAIFEFIEGWYNPHRLHGSLSYRGPATYEAAYTA